MKIAVWHNLPSGGGKRALYDHVKALINVGHTIEAWTTDFSSSEYLPLNEIIIEHRKPFKTEYLKLLKISNPLKREQMLAELLNKHSLECIKEIEKKDFDLLFANSCGITGMPYIGKFAKIPKIAYIGEPCRELYEAIPDNKWKAPYQKLKLKKIKRLYNDYFLNYSRRLKVLNEINAANCYDRILVNSSFSRESVIRSYGIDATVCYLGVNTEYFTPAEKKEPYVVGLGSITFNKSVEKAIHIISKIPSKPVLKWIGNGLEKKYLNDLIRLANDLKIDFQYFINIADSELISLISKAAVMIYIPKMEPFGLAPLEANACGTYVIALAEGGVRESITNGINGNLLTNYNPNHFASELNNFINDLDMAKNKGLQSRKFVCEFWNIRNLSKNINEQINDCYKNRKILI